MYEVDFLKVGTAGKSGDAIAMRYTYTNPAGAPTQIVAVIDGGFRDVAQDIEQHVRTHYGTDTIDLVISTHPDGDHINGLTPLIQNMNVTHLLVHNPRNHVNDVSDLGVDEIDNLIAAARARGTSVEVEPFAGVSAFDGTLQIVGPTREFYRAQLAEQQQFVRTGALRPVTKAAGELRRAVLASLPAETLDDSSSTTPRNNASVICLLTVDNRRSLFTGDAGIEGLTLAADFMDANDLAGNLHLFQAPHHGGHGNVGPTILDRFLATGSGTAVVSASLQDPDHPSPKVTNALKRRGYEVYTNEKGPLLHHFGSTRGWGSATPVPIMDESS